MGKRWDFAGQLALGKLDACSISLTTIEPLVSFTFQVCLSVVLD